MDNHQTFYAAPSRSVLIEIFAFSDADYCIRKGFRHTFGFMLLIFLFMK